MSQMAPCGLARRRQYVARFMGVYHESLGTRKRYVYRSSGQVVQKLVYRSIVIDTVICLVDSTAHAIFYGWRLDCPIHVLVSYLQRRLNSFTFPHPVALFHFVQFADAHLVYFVIQISFTSRPPLPYLTLSYLTLPYLTSSDFTLSYFTLPYLTLPCLTSPWFILFNLTIPLLPATIRRGRVL